MTETPDVLRARLGAQLLSGTPGRSPAEVTRRILAIQAQDARGARLAIRARSWGLTSADVDRAFTEERSLLITWLNRGTLHLVRRDDYPWLHALTAPRQLAWITTRLGQLGVSPDEADRGVDVIARGLANGPLSRAELRDLLAASGAATAGQSFVHQIGLASLRGLVVRGPMRGGEQCFVLARDWLGEREPIDRPVALAELARRYLAGHSPASERDLAYWSGLTLRDARAGFRAIARELVELPGGLLAPAGWSEPPDLPPPRLLGPFDPVLHGWASRDWVAGGHGSLVTSNGVFRPLLLVDGRAVGTWTLRAGRGVELRPFGRLDAPTLAALESDGLDVLRYLVAGPAERVPLASPSARPPRSLRASSQRRP
jgi:hypothetical protein